jgi:hypothetical protein
LFVSTTAGIDIYRIVDGKVSPGAPDFSLALFPSRQGTRFTTSQDGNRLAVIEDEARLRVVEENGTLVFTQTLRSPVSEAVLSPSGDRLVVVDCIVCSGSYEHAYVIWDISSRAPNRLGSGRGSGPVFSPDGGRLLIVQNRTLRILSTTDWKPVAGVSMNPNWQGYQALFSPDGDLLAIAHDHQLDLWRLDLQGGQTPPTLTPLPPAPSGPAAPAQPDLILSPFPLAEYTHADLAFSFDGRWIGVMDSAGYVHAWQTWDGQALPKQATGEPGAPFWLEAGGKARVIDLNSLPSKLTLHEGLAWLAGVGSSSASRLPVFEFTPDGRALVAAGEAGMAGASLCKWSMDFSEEPPCLQTGEAGPLFTDGQGQVYRLQTVGEDRWAVFEVAGKETGLTATQPLTEFYVDGDSLRPLAAARGAEYFAYAQTSASTSGEVLGIRNRRGEEVYSLEVQGRLQLARFSADGARLMALVQDDVGVIPRLPGLVIFDIPTGDLIFLRSVYARSRLSGAAISPDGSQAAYWLERWGREAWSGLSTVQLEPLKAERVPG